MHTVRQWLEELGLPQYAEAFVENDVDLEALRLLTEGDLEKLGVSLGHRKKTNLPENPSVPTPSVGSLR